MSAPPRTLTDYLVAPIRANALRVDHACQRFFGIGIKMWRTLEAIVSLGALMLAGYAIDAGADPLLSLFLAAVIISGPKVLEWWAVHEDYLDYQEVLASRQSNDDNDE